MSSYYINPQALPTSFRLVTCAPKATAPTTVQLHFPEVALKLDLEGHVPTTRSEGKGEVVTDIWICKDPGYRQEAEKEGRQSGQKDWEAGYGRLRERC